jgi:chaperonin GroES
VPTSKERAKASSTAPKASSTAPKASITARSARGARSKKTAEAPEIKLTGDRLVVRASENGERRTSAGLLIPATAMPAPKRLSWGDVTLVGPEVRVAKEGDRVLFLPSAGLEVELDDEELVLLRERDVQAVSSQPATRDHAPGQYL